MKRSSFIRELTKAGRYLKRHGKKHDIYINPQNYRKVPIPHHTETKDSLCNLIRKQLGLEE